MNGYEKVYVSLMLKIGTDGTMHPLELLWEDSARYNVDRVLRIFPAPPPHVGGACTQKYECLIEGNKRDLYYEKDANRWFVEKRVF